MPGFNHSTIGRASVTNDGIGVSRRSSPRSAASTSGPHINAARLRLSGNPSTRNVFGNDSDTVSPVLHVRFNSTYDPGAGKFATAFPFTDTTKPSPAHDGRRSKNVNVFGLRSGSFNVAASPSGNVVSIVTVALCQLAVEGTYKLTQKRSPDS